MIYAYCWDSSTDVEKQVRCYALRMNASHGDIFHTQIDKKNNWNRMRLALAALQWREIPIQFIQMMKSCIVIFFLSHNHFNHRYSQNNILFMRNHQFRLEQQYLPESKANTTTYQMQINIRRKYCWKHTTNAFRIDESLLFRRNENHFGIGYSRANAICLVITSQQFCLFLLFFCLNVILPKKYLVAVVVFWRFRECCHNSVIAYGRCMQF